MLYFDKFATTRRNYQSFLNFSLRGLGLGGKCDMLLVNSILIFMSKNLLKVRIAVVTS